ncbi:MAG: phosphoglycerate dehydrogenase [Gemmatimonadota bacterium]
MSAGRVLVCAALEFRGREPARALMEGAGLEIVRRVPGPGTADEQTRDQLAGVGAILAGSERIDATTLSKADRLRVVARNGVGYDAVDVGRCTALGIVVTITPGTLSDAVADHTLALLLAAVRHLAIGDRAVKAGQYDVPYGEDLASMTLGLVGCGRIGTEVVRRALAFKMRVLVCDPKVDSGRVAALGATAASLDQLLAQSDAVSLHLPLSRDTAGMVDAAFLARMKPGSVFVNTARGGIVDEPALIDALRRGHLAAAGLDCQASEPPTGASLELVRLENVVAMPHSGSKTITARERMSVMAAQSIVDVLQGRRPEAAVNPEVFAKLGLE